MYEPQSYPDIISHLKKSQQKLHNSWLAQLSDLSGDMPSLLGEEWPETAAAIKNAYQGGNVKFKISAICAMGINCDPQWLPILLDELKNKSAEIRYEAASAFGEMEAESSVADLAELLNDPDTEVQLAAVGALGKIGSKSARESLKKCLEHPKEAVSKPARQLLDELDIAEGLLPSNASQS